MGFLKTLFQTVAGPLVSGLFGVGGSASTNAANLRAVREQNKGNMELAKYAADRNYELWQENNAYNTPSAQMARYKEAGLNPNLVYGGNPVAAGNSQSPASGYTAPHLERYQRTSSPISDGVNAALNRYYQERNLDADVNLKDAQADALRAEAKKKMAELVGQEYSNKYAGDTLEYRIREQNWKTASAQQNFFNMLAQEGYTRAQTEKVATDMLLNKAMVALTKQKTATEKFNTEYSRTGVLVNYAKANNINTDTVLKRTQMSLNKAMEQLTKTNSYYRGIEVGKLTEEIVRLGQTNDIEAFRNSIEKKLGLDAKSASKVVVDILNNLINLAR